MPTETGKFRILQVDCGELDRAPGMSAAMNALLTGPMLNARQKDHAITPTVIMGTP